MKTALNATAKIVGLLFAHRGGRYVRGMPVQGVQASPAAAHTPDENDPFSYAYFGA